MNDQEYDLIAQVLEAHLPVNAISPRCQCGWGPSLSLNSVESDRRQHRRHVATMLAEGEFGTRYDRMKVALGEIADKAHAFDVEAVRVPEVGSDA